MMESGKVVLTVQSADKIFCGVTIQMKPQTGNKRFSRIFDSATFAVCQYTELCMKTDKYWKKRKRKKKGKKRT